MLAILSCTNVCIYVWSSSAHDHVRKALVQSLNNVYLVLCMLDCSTSVGFTCLFLVYLLGVVIVVIACVVLFHATLSMSANIVLWIIPFPCLYNGVNYEEIFFPVWLCWLWKVSVNVGSGCECGDWVWVWEVDVSVGSGCECGNWLSVGNGWVWVVTVSVGTDWVGVGGSVGSDCECGSGCECGEWLWVWELTECGEWMSLQVWVCWGETAFCTMEPL